MKTSNKLLLAPIGLFLLFSLMGMIHFKNSLVPRGIGDGEHLIHGSGTLQKKVLPVSAFTKIEGKDGMEFELVKGTEAVEIEAEENLLPYFETKVEEGALSIAIKEGYSVRPSEDKPIKIQVGFQQLNKVNSFAGASIIMKDTATTERFRADAHAGSNMTILVKADYIKLEAHSGSDLQVKGTCNHLDATSHSAGDIKAFDLICKEVANVSSHSGANLYLTVNGIINASAHSGADIVYRGAPKQVNGHSHSGGNVRAD